MKSILFTLNGKKTDIAVEEDETLLYTLRERLRITSVKEGCSIGECGTCTVLIDNEPHYSCLTLASKVNGRDVKTVEYLSDSGRLHPLQEAFIKSGAVQCGYCTPGMLLSAYSLLLKNRKPDKEMIKAAISGNLCRCTGYHQIVDAVKDAGDSLSASPFHEPEQEKPYPVQERKKEDILSLLASSEKGKIYAGGTDILVNKRKGDITGSFIDITNVPEWNGIRDNNGIIHIGATTTHRQVAENTLIREKALSLSCACSMVGTPQIRNMGTIGGNIVNASPAADSIPPLLIHDALCILESVKGVRKEPLTTFIVAPYKTSIRDNEILTGIDIQGLKGYREGYRRVTKRATWAIARMSVAWAIKEDNGMCKDVRLSIGSCTPMPFRPEEVEAFLRGKQKDDKTIRTAIAMVIHTIRTISGNRPSFVYKIPVLEGLLYSILRGSFDAS